MCKGFIWLLKVCLAGVLALGILSVFSMFYFYTGVHRPNPSGATDFRWPNQLVIDRQEGNAVLRYDANGFNNLDPDFDRPIDNLMMGNSQMEAVHNKAGDNAAAMLNELCPEQYTYNIAMGSHTIYTCVKNLENALQEYEPTTAVLLQVSSLELDLDDMQLVLDGKYPTLPSYDTSLLAWLQTRVPACKLIYKQLEDWVEVNTANGKEPAQAQTLSTKEYKEATTAFLKKAADTVDRHGVRLIIFYIPPTEIAPDGSMTCLSDPEMLASFAGACEENGIVFLDMTEDFNALYEQQHKTPYGYANTRVGKGHMNKYGQQAVAQRLAQVL